MANKIRVLIGAHHDADGGLIRDALGTYEQFEARRATSVSECVTSLRDEVHDCVVLCLRGSHDGVSAVLNDSFPAMRGTPLIVVAANSTQEMVIASMRAGASDYLPIEGAMFGDQLRERIEAVVGQARGRALHRRRARRRLRSLRQAARTDPLTGLPNRRHLPEWLRSNRSRNDRRANVAFIMVDLDYFKSVNDNFGHCVGDSILVAAARAINGECREDEVVVRWGGEEFLILRGSGSLEESWSWTDRVRRSIADIRIGEEASAARIAASLGLAIVPTAEFGEHSLWIADRALHLAKELGRDRVCTWPMVLAHEAAESVQLEPNATASDRAARFVSMLSEHLGSAQREHLGPHSRLARSIAGRLARELHLEDQEVSRASSAALVHDAGKAALPEALLSKKSALTVGEKGMIVEHTRLGASLAEAMGLPTPVVRLVARYTDRFDSEAMQHSIPLERTNVGIVSTADALASMIVDRPYAPRRSFDDALGELRRGSGGQFDPVVVGAVHSAYGAARRTAA